MLSAHQWKDLIVGLVFGDPNSGHCPSFESLLFRSLWRLEKCNSKLLYTSLCIFICYTINVKNVFVFFKVGPPKEDIFLTTFYGLYFSHHYTYDKLQSFKCWTSVGNFHVLHLHLSFWHVGTLPACTSVSMWGSVPGC